MDGGGCTYPDYALRRASACTTCGESGRIRCQAWSWRASSGRVVQGAVMAPMMTIKAFSMAYHEQSPLVLTWRVGCSDRYSHAFSRRPSNETTSGREASPRSKPPDTRTSVTDGIIQPLQSTHARNMPQIWNWGRDLWRTCRLSVQRSNFTRQMMTWCLLVSLSQISSRWLQVTLRHHSRVPVRVQPSASLSAMQARWRTRTCTS